MPVKLPLTRSFRTAFTAAFTGISSAARLNYLLSGQIDQFTLDIQRGHISFLRRRYALNVEANNQYAPSEIELTGRVVHNPGGAFPSGVLVISFNSDGDGHFCTMAYNKCQLNRRLFFRRGALLIQSRGEEILPVIQSFIFTRQKIDLNDEAGKAALQGALALIDPASKMILIPKSDLDCFMDSALMKKYFKNKEAYDSACEEYVELDEERLLKMDVNNMELYRTLFQIKSKAAIAKLYTFLITDRSWHYIGTLCRQEESYEQEQ